GFLLVFRTLTLSLFNVYNIERVARDTRVFQHTAGCSPQCHHCGGQRPLPAKGLPTLGTPVTSSGTHAPPAGRSFLPSSSRRHEGRTVSSTLFEERGPAYSL